MRGWCGRSRSRSMLMSPWMVIDVLGCFSRILSMAIWRSGMKDGFQWGRR